MTEQTIYTIPYDPEYWGSDVTPEQALRSARWLRHELKQEFPEVEFRLVPKRQSWSNRASGDKDLIEEVKHREESLLTEVPWDDEGAPQ